MQKTLKKFCTTKIFSYFCNVIKPNYFMKKSEILNALINEDCSVVNLVVKDEDNYLSLEGTFYPINAMRMIKKLPARFHYSYTPIELL